MALLSARAYARLLTEQANPRTRDIDRRSTARIARLIIAEDRLVPLAVARVASDVARGIDALAASLASGGSVLLLGAGTSGRLAVLEAAECPPTFNTTPRQIRAVIAGGRPRCSARRKAPRTGRSSAAGRRPPCAAATR